VSAVVPEVALTHDREIAESLPRQVPMRDGQVV
jgi:hypothetical protein